MEEFLVESLLLPDEPVKDLPWQHRSHPVSCQPVEFAYYMCLTTVGPSTRKSPIKVEAVPQHPANDEEVLITSTPVRSSTEASAEMTMMNKNPTTDEAPETTKAVTVSPPDAGSKEGTAAEKQVRFDSGKVPVAAESEEPLAESRTAKRGRFVSPQKQPPSSSQSPGGAVLEFKTYRSPSRNHKRDEEVPSLCSSSSDAPIKRSKGSTIPTVSISVDPSQDSTTSPLASHDGGGDKTAKSSHAGKGADSSKLAHEPVLMSPKRTEGSMYEDGTLQSPGNYFLSPHPPTPPRSNLQATASFEEKKSEGKTECKPSPRDREHIVATPTNFALDYGKQVTGSFDTSNVLAWLQSPTAQGLFSPGALGSVMNTPAARTPRTPTVSTSFFFSDVASLPRHDSPKAAENDDKQSQKGGISNIICISPLASSRNRTGTPAASTPMNFKDFFASPREKARALPLLNDTPSRADRLKVPQRSASKDPSLDAVHMAERDLMEDEDLSVLLQLASNTPRPGERDSGPSVGPVFRSPNRRKGDDGNLPGLQIPMIGNGRENDTKTRLMQKSSRSREHPDTQEYADSRLGIRSNSAIKDEEDADAAGKSEKSKGDLSKKPPTNTTQTHPYGLPFTGAHPGLPGEMQSHYYAPMPNLPPGVTTGRSGSMRVVVGVPPPQRDGKGGSPSRSGGPHGPPSYHDYPPPPNGMPFPPPGMYPNSYAPYNGMGRYQPSYYPPPPRHMPMYNAQHPPGGAKDAKKSKTKLGKHGAGGKRAGSPLLEPKNPASNKKLKKSPQKKKNRSPQPETGGERIKSAAAIQAVNAASGGKNDKAAALAAAILRGVTMRPSGKWQAQLYFAGKSRYIGVFDTREKAALAYEIAREKLKSGHQEAGGLTAKSTENLVNAARKAAFEGVNERAPK